MGNSGESLTVFDFPTAHCIPLRTTNSLERINRELRRRTRVASIFPKKLLHNPGFPLVPRMIREGIGRCGGEGFQGYGASLQKRGGLYCFLSRGVMGSRRGSQRYLS